MQLKFLTLNIWHGGLLMDHLLPFLQSEQADIMCLQEVNDEGANSLPPNFRSIETLKKYFPSHQIVFNPGVKLHYRKEQVMIEQGNATLSRYPISHHRLIYFDSEYGQFESPLPGDKPDYRVYPKYMQKSWIELGGKVLLVINLHGTWDFHGDDTPERMSMAQTILSHAKEEEYVIIAGDSNAWWNTKTIGSLMSQYPSIITENLVSTFNMRQKTDPGYAKAAVDILLASPNIKVLESACPQVDVSDHLPLTATLEF